MHHLISAQYVHVIDTYLLKIFILLTYDSHASWSFCAFSNSPFNTSYFMAV